jgi:hypothetical protein
VLKNSPRRCRLNREAPFSILSTVLSTIPRMQRAGKRRRNCDAGALEPGDFRSTDAIFSANIGLQDSAFHGKDAQKYLAFLQKITVRAWEKHRPMGFFFCEIGQPRKGLKVETKEKIETVFRGAFEKMQLSPPQILWADRNESLVAVLLNDVEVERHFLEDNLDSRHTWRNTQVIDIRRSYGLVRVLHSHQPKSDLNPFTPAQKRTVMEKMCELGQARGIDGCIAVGDFNMSPVLVLSELQKWTEAGAPEPGVRLFYPTAGDGERFTGNADKTGADLGFSFNLETIQVDVKVDNRKGANHDAIVAAWHLPATPLSTKAVSEHGDWGTSDGETSDVQTGEASAKSDGDIDDDSSDAESTEEKEDEGSKSEASATEPGGEDTESQKLDDLDDAVGEEELHTSMDVVVRLLGGLDVFTVDSLEAKLCIDELGAGFTQEERNHIVAAGKLLLTGQETTNTKDAVRVRKQSELREVLAGMREQRGRSMRRASTERASSDETRRCYNEWCKWWANREGVSKREQRSKFGAMLKRVMGHKHIAQALLRTGWPNADAVASSSSSFGPPSTSARFRAAVVWFRDWMTDFAQARLEQQDTNRYETAKRVSGSYKSSGLTDAERSSQQARKEAESQWLWGKYLKEENDEAVRRRKGKYDYTTYKHPRLYKDMRQFEQKLVDGYNDWSLKRRVQLLTKARDGTRFRVPPLDV